MDWHQPKNGDSEVLESIELGGDAVEVALRREGAWKDFIDDAIANPIADLACGYTRHITRCLPPRRAAYHRLESVSCCRLSNRGTQTKVYATAQMQRGENQEVSE